jgi:hypothetical protein
MKAKKKGDSMKYSQLSTFAVVSEAFSLIDKVKIVLFAAGTKPTASVYLNITSGNLDDKERFEEILKQNKIIFLKGRERSFETVKSIRGASVRWSIAGTYIDYDLFSSEKDKKQFITYRKLAIKDTGRSRRVRIAGKIYGYPKCCIEKYVKETTDWLKSHTKYHEFYKRYHMTDKKFPFIPFTPCKLGCKRSQKLNQLYARTVRKIEPKLYKQYTKKIQYRTDLVIDHESVVAKGKVDIFPDRKWHNYVVLAMKPYKGKYYFYSFLTNKKYEHGDVLSGKIVVQYGRGFVQPGKIKRKIKLKHIRKLPMLGRKY